MAGKRQTDMRFDARFFDNILKSAGVERLTVESANRVLAVAKLTAPVASGAYRDGLVVVTSESRYRTVSRVVGTDSKTLLIESKTGNLARAAKAVKP